MHLVFLNVFFKHTFYKKCPMYAPNFTYLHIKYVVMHIKNKTIVSKMQLKIHFWTILLEYTQ